MLPPPITIIPPTHTIHTGGAKVQGIPQTFAINPDTVAPAPDTATKHGIFNPLFCDSIAYSLTCHNYIKKFL